MNMLKTAISIVLLILSTDVCGQFAVVRDPDGYCNVRRDPAVDPKNVVGKVVNGDVVYCFESSGNWTHVDYTTSGEERTGYIYSNRLVDVSQYVSIPMTTKEQSRVVLLNDSITIIVERQPFVSALHKFMYMQEGVLSTIDGGPVWGKDGGMPQWEYKSVRVTLGGKEFFVPAEGLRNLYEPTLMNTKAHYDRSSKALYIVSMNGDGAGGYVVMWKFTTSTYAGRFVYAGF